MYAFKEGETPSYIDKIGKRKVGTQKWGGGHNCCVIG